MEVFDTLDEQIFKKYFKIPLTVLILSIPACLVALGNLFLLRESPRYLLSRQKIPEAVEIMNNMGKQINKEFLELTAEEI